MGLHVFPIPIPPPTSLSTRSLQVFPMHQVRALVSCIQPGLVICFTLLYQCQLLEISSNTFFNEWAPHHRQLRLIHFDRTQKEPGYLLSISAVSTFLLSQKQGGKEILIKAEVEINILSEFFWREVIAFILVLAFPRCLIFIVLFYSIIGRLSKTASWTVSSHRDQGSTMLFFMRD